MSGIVRLLFQAIFISLFAFKVTASEPRIFGDWSLDCPDSESSCVLAQTVASADRIWLATLRVVVSGAEGHETAIIQFLVPPSVHLASGIFSTVAPGDALQATYVRCNVNVCEAVLNVDVDELADWKRGRVAELRYRPAADRPPVVFEASLRGISAGILAATREAE